MSQMCDGINTVRPFLRLIRMMMAQRREAEVPANGDVKQWRKLSWINGSGRALLVTDNNLLPSVILLPNVWAKPRISLNPYKAENMGQCINWVDNGGGRIEVKCGGIQEIA